MREISIFTRETNKESKLKQLPYSLIKLFFVIFLCSNVIACPTKCNECDHCCVIRRLDSLERKNDLLNLELKTTKEKYDEKIESLNNRVSDWGVYSSILAGILLIVAGTSFYISNRSAKDIAYRELGEAKENIEKELSAIKNKAIDATKKYQQFNEMLEQLKEGAGNKMK